MIRKSDVHELDINKLKTVLSTLYNVKDKVDKLIVNNLETFPVDLKYFSNAHDKDVTKNKNIVN